MCYDFPQRILDIAFWGRGWKKAQLIFVCMRVYTYRHACALMTLCKFPWEKGSKRLLSKMDEERGKIPLFFIPFHCLQLFGPQNVAPAQAKGACARKAKFANTAENKLKTFGTRIVTTIQITIWKSCRSCRRNMPLEPKPNLILSTDFVCLFDLHCFPRRAEMESLFTRVEFKYVFSRSANL